MAVYPKQTQAAGGWDLSMQMPKGHSIRVCGPNILYFDCVFFNTTVDINENLFNCVTGRITIQRILFINKFNLFLFLCMCVHACVLVHHVFALSVEARRGHSIPSSWSY